MNQGNLNVLTGTTSGKTKKIHHHTTAGAMLFLVLNIPVKTFLGLIALFKPIKCEALVIITNSIPVN